MTDPFDYVDKLAMRARQDRAPQGDVSQRILYRLAEQESRVGSGAARRHGRIRVPSRRGPSCTGRRSSNHPPRADRRDGRSELSIHL